MSVPYLRKAPAQLAIDGLRAGLTRRLGGWSGAEPREVISGRTINALVARGVAVISPDGRKATLARPEFEA